MISLKALQGQAGVRPVTDGARLQAVDSLDVLAKSDRVARRAVAVSAVTVLVTFLIVAWVVVIVELWLLASHPEGSIPDAAALIGPLHLLIAAAAGCVVAAFMLLALARGAARKPAGGDDGDPREPEAAPVATWDERHAA